MVDPEHRSAEAEAEERSGSGSSGGEERALEHATKDDARGEGESDGEEVQEEGLGHCPAQEEEENGPPSEGVGVGDLEEMEKRRGAGATV